MGLWNPNIIGRLKLAGRNLRSLSSNQLPLTDEIFVGVETTNNHLVQINSTGKVIDLAKPNQLDSVGMDCAILWDFQTDIQGWVVAGGTFTWQADRLCARLVASGTGFPVIAKNNFSVDGNKYRYVKVCYTRLNRDTTLKWRGSVLYETNVAGSPSLGNFSGGSNHSLSGSFRAAIDEPMSELGFPVVVTFDMSDLISGGNDWITNTIIGIRVDLPLPNVLETIDIHWIAICGDGPPLSGEFAGINSKGEVKAIKLKSELLTDLTTVPQNTIFLSAEKDALVIPKFITGEQSELMISPFLTALGRNAVIFSPAAAGSGTGSGTGGTWTSNGTASHQVVNFTTMSASIMRTRYANVATTANQILGITSTAGGLRFFPQKGIYFYCMFALDLIPAQDTRLFVGLHSTIVGQVTSDTINGQYFALIRDASHPISGVGSLRISAQSSAGGFQNVNISESLIAGKVYELYLYIVPTSAANNAQEARYKLVDYNTGTVIVDAFLGGGTFWTTTTPVAMAAQATMSNGNINPTVTTTAIGVADLRCMSIL